MVPFSTRLPGDSARLFLAGVISLLPGTLVIDLRREVLQIHALDAACEVEAELRKLERHVAALFDVELETASEVAS
jgi:multicomponent Na+:H+ antiporter subunit E